MKQRGKMFNQLYLIIEENKLKKRFKGNVVTAVLEVLNKETDVQRLKLIYQTLWQFNDAIKFWDELIGYTSGDEEWEEYEKDFYSRYTDILLNNLQKLYLRTGRFDFMQEYSKAYWKQVQESILQLWKKLPEGKSVVKNEVSFQKIFEDFFNETIKTFPDFLVKRLQEFHNLYRASRYQVFDNYKYIIPDPAYCHDNRWNDDGVAYLYLSYDNENKECQGIKQAKKTCFEELRGKEGEQLSVCKFKAIHKRVKILDLSYDGIDYEEQLQELGTSEENYKERILQTVQENSKLYNRMKAYAQNGNKEAFNKELDRLQKQAGLDREIHDKVQLQLSKILIGNICDSIFYAVDKEDDPNLEAYIPFRAFSRYLISQGFGGVAYRSTRMALIGLQGKCITLFNPEDAIYIDGEMEVYEYHKDGCNLITRYGNKP